MAIKPSPTIAGKLRKLFGNNKQTIEPAIGDSIPGGSGSAPSSSTGGVLDLSKLARPVIDGQEYETIVIANIENQEFIESSTRVDAYVVDLEDLEDVPYFTTLASINSDVPGMKIVQFGQVYGMVYGATAYGLYGTATDDYYTHYACTLENSSSCISVLLDNENGMILLPKTAKFKLVYREQK